MMQKTNLIGLMIILSLTSSIHTFAQISAPLTTEDVVKLVNPDEKKWRNVFVSIGGEFVEEYAINTVLFDQEVPTLPTSLFYLGAGFSYRNQDFLDTFEAELGFNFTNNEEDELDFGSTYNEIQIQLRYERKLAEIETSFFSGGLQAKYALSNLDIYPLNTFADLNELTSQQNTTAIQLQTFFIGPSFSFNWINPNADRLMLKIMLNYDFNLVAGEWESQYGETLNTFNEDAPRFSIRLQIPIYF